jgi:hypothetical protein
MWGGILQVMAICSCCPGLEGGTMNTLEKEEIAPHAAKLFEKEIL